MNPPILDKETLIEQIQANSPFIEPDYLTTLRKNALSQVNELTLPTRREEDWQFTDLSALYHTQFQSPDPVSLESTCIPQISIPEAKNSRLVFLNGFYSPELSDFSAIPPEIWVGHWHQLSNSQKNILVNYLGKQSAYPNIFTALNTAQLRDVAIIWVNPDISLDFPLHLLWLSLPTDTPIFSQPRTLIVLEKNTKIELIEEYKAITQNCVDIPLNKPYFNNAVTEIYLKENAHLNHTRLQRESGDGIHIAQTAIAQDRHSDYTGNEINIGSQLYRHSLEIRQIGEQINTSLNGLTALKDQQIADTHSAVYLTAPHSTINQLHKYILDDQSQGIFNGKICVPKAAQMTNAAQLNRNLLLSAKARINTKPELHITADNVKCSHGATVSQLEADELFYLQSRGLNENDARTLLIDAFAAEIIEEIPTSSLRQRLTQCVACRNLE